jgi:hypothetical protein
MHAFLNGGMLTLKRIVIFDLRYIIIDNSSSSFYEGAKEREKN